MKKSNPERFCLLEYDKLIIDQKIYVWNDVISQVDKIQRNKEVVGVENLLKSVLKSPRVRQIEMQYMYIRPKIVVLLKVAVSRDFFYFFYFINPTHLGPW